MKTRMRYRPGGGDLVEQIELPPIGTPYPRCSGLSVTGYEVEKTAEGIPVVNVIYSTPDYIAPNSPR